MRPDGLLSLGEDRHDIVRDIMQTAGGRGARVVPASSDALLSKINERDDDSSPPQPTTS